MIAIDEINVRMPGRAEEDGVARRPSDRGMGSWIISPEVGFDLDDAAGEKFAALAADENFTQQLRADHAWVAVVESAREGAEVR